MPQTHYLIDPPSPFAPAEDWRDYLAELQEALAEAPSPPIERAIAEAEHQLTSEFD